jgi:hypothetical protein
VKQDKGDGRKEFRVEKRHQYNSFLIYHVEKFLKTSKLKVGYVRVSPIKFTSKQNIKISS